MYLHHPLLTLTLILSLASPLLSLPTKLKNPFRSKPKQVDKAVQVPYKVDYDMYLLIIGHVYTNDFDRHLHTNGALSELVNHDWDNDEDYVNPTWLARWPEEKLQVATAIQREWAKLPIEQRKDTFTLMFETEWPGEPKWRLEEPGEDLSQWEGEFVRRVFLGPPEDE
jgi:hypothetical protein